MTRGSAPACTARGLPAKAVPVLLCRCGTHTDGLDPSIRIPEILDSTLTATCTCCAGAARVSMPDFPSIARHSLMEPGYGSFGSSVRDPPYTCAAAYDLPHALLQTRGRTDHCLVFLRPKTSEGM